MNELRSKSITLALKKIIKLKKYNTQQQIDPLRARMPQKDTQIFL